MLGLNKNSIRNIIKLLSNHLYLLLLLPLIFIIFPLLNPGVVMFGDFPLVETSLDGHRFLSTWIEYGSHHGFETLSRYPIIVLGVILNTLGVGSDIISKFLVLLGFFAASLSFYFSFILYFKDKLGNHVLRYRIAAIVGSIFYAYNVWSFHRFHHWYLWLGYALLPLFIVTLIYSLKNPNKWAYVLVVVITWSLASSTPHMVVFYGLFYLSFSIYFIIRNVTNKQAILKLGITILSILLMYLVINLYWIYPETMYILNGGGTFAPSVLLTQEETEILSRDSNFLNVFRLIEDWWEPRIIEVSPPQTSLFYPFWLVASFVFPILAFLSLLLKKRSKDILLFSIIGIIGILLTLGTNGPFNFYSIFLFEIPLFSILQFLFRDPDKWGFMIALAFSFLLSITSLELLKRGTQLRHKRVIGGSFVTFIFVCFILYSYPTYSSTSDKALDPVSLPQDYEALNNYLQKNAIERVLFIFQDHGPTIWNKEREFCCLDQRSSAAPNMMIYPTHFRNYHDYLINSIMSNKSHNINNFIYPTGTSNVIYSNDELNSDDTKLRQLSQLQEFKNIKDIGFFKLFKADEKDNAGELQIPKQNVVIVGGLDLFNSLNSLPSLSTINSSLVFLDQGLKKNLKDQLVDSADYLVLPKNNDDLTLSFLDEKYVIRPFDSTYRDDPSKVWSRTVAGDPENADFQPYLQRLGIDNWDFDYGKGLAMTSAMGSNLSLPVDKVYQNLNDDGKANNFYLFMRYLKNQEGGPMRISLDGKVIKEVDSLDRISNTFVWEQIAPINLTKESRDLTIQNVAGFNAVNLFAIIPPEELNKLKAETAHLLDDRVGIVYILEAESNFYNNRGIGNDSFVNLSNKFKSVSEDQNVNTSTKTLTDQFRVPPNRDLVTFQFFSNKNEPAGSSTINELQISPAYEKYNVFRSNFEKESTREKSLPTERLEEFRWINENKDTLSISTESNVAISGNSSLKMDIKAASTLEEKADSPWNIISSDFIPINHDAYYNASLEISAKDVIQLHSRVLYYDPKMREITNKIDFIFDGRDGTFRDAFASSISPPKEARYLKYQILTGFDNTKSGSLILDNVKLDEITPSSISVKNRLNGNLSEKIEQTDMRFQKEDSLGRQNMEYNSTHYVTQTHPITVKGNYLYNYTIKAQAKNMSSLSSFALFTKSDDVVENSTGYGNNASNGAVLSLSDSSEVRSMIDIVKSSNYTIAVRAETCETCTFLRITIKGDEYDMDNKNIIQTSNISLQDKYSGLRWLYSNVTNLKKGTYELEIYSDSRAILDSVVIYQTDNENSSQYNNKNSETLVSVFSPDESPASIASYKKIGPTKYEVKILNATRDYVLALSESYDPLWKVYAEQDDNLNATDSIPLFSIINGFIIKKTGNYTLTIEYQPQQWFIEAAILSLMVLVTIILVYLLGTQRLHLNKLKAHIWNLLKQN